MFEILPILAHMLGDEELVELLKKKGYNVKRGKVDEREEL